jgi:NADP-dependent 3-hydroxy acid dehydrogenase YdfG
MSKIIQVGATSELGSALSAELLSYYPFKFHKIVRIGQKNESDNSIIPIDITEPHSIVRAIECAEVKNGDVAIIAVGHLGGVNLLHSIENAKLDDIYLTISINASLAASLLIGFIQAFKKVDGGNIIIFTSVASHPVLESNLIYGESKAILERFIRHMRPIAEDARVNVCVVRNSFVSTKMNNGRNSTPFGTTSKKVSEKVAKSYQSKKIIWIPTVWKLISFSLRNIPLLKMVAEKKLRTSL